MLKETKAVKGSTSLMDLSYSYTDATGHDRMLVQTRTNLLTNATTTYTYGDGNVGDVTTTTDPDGNASTTTYDSYGDVLASTVTATDQCGSSCGSSDKTSYT